MPTAHRHWLDRYATGYHRWRRIEDGSSELIARPLGLVETAFHYDGTLFEGRADVYLNPVCEVRTSLNRGGIRNQILHAWAALRAERGLLRAKTQHAGASGQLTHAALDGQCFVIGVPNSVETLLDEARRTLRFAEDDYEHLNPDQFVRHAMNTARVFDASEGLAQAYVLPLESTSEAGRFNLRTLVVCAHDILDGMTGWAWAVQLHVLLNEDIAALRSRMLRALDPHRLWDRLPPAQEDIYPVVKGTAARQRWYWAIARVLRHVRRPPPAAFSNPLRRDEALHRAESMDPLFDKILDYRTVPPLNSYVFRVTLPASETGTLHQWCRQAGTSIGAGGFAIIALAMMECHEERFPNVPLGQRKAFVASFPLNPRHFFDYAGPPDSLMLAFSDGIMFPFLPSGLPVEGRFKLLAKLAHRQLGIYQKRPRSRALDSQLGSRSVAQIIPALYTAFVELADHLEPPTVRPAFAPQGIYPSNFGAQQATCGVSSIGDYAGLLRSVQRPLDGSTAFQASLRSLASHVRVRDHEFLCGTGSGPDGFEISVSFDGNAIDEDRVTRWAAKIKRLLQPRSPTTRL